MLHDHLRWRGLLLHCLTRQHSYRHRGTLVSELTSPTRKRAVVQETATWDGADLAQARKDLAESGPKSTGSNPSCPPPVRRR